MLSILVIQTAFIGDAVLATSLLESIHQEYPDARVSMLVRKGNESLFSGHPFLHEVLTWDKKKNKYAHLIGLIWAIRRKKYDAVINLQRYGATGLITVLSGARKTIGFDKNPFHYFFTRSVKHQMGTESTNMHEIERNHLLLQAFASDSNYDKKLPAPAMPALYPGQASDAYTQDWKQLPYICIAPSSVWFTKQFPLAKWAELIGALPADIQVYILGAPSDALICEQLVTMSQRANCVSLAGKCNFLQSASLMRDAIMNYVNDSAPMHFCSSVNAPVTVVYCSTVPAFGYGPLSSNSTIVETTEELACRPCGLHGKKSCPLGHFDCANTIRLSQLMASLPA